jgi:hypothetical protein
MAAMNPIKLCECGCGQPTAIASRNRHDKGHIKGQPLPFLPGHSSRGRTQPLGNTRVGHIWRTMIARCHNPKHISYPGYGGRGITVCVEWRQSLAAFIADMGQPPKGKSIDRIDNDGSYCRSNCRWATRKEQSNNSRRNRLITAFGKTRTLQQWADVIGITAGRIRQRLDCGWSIDRALSATTKEWTISELAAEFSMQANTLSERIRRGWSLKRSLFQPVHRSNRM